jgi:hypothetical protein
MPAKGREWVRACCGVIGRARPTRLCGFCVKHDEGVRAFAGCESGLTVKKKCQNRADGEQRRTQNRQTDYESSLH